MAAWKSTGHLFLALDQCGCSAGWLLAQIRVEKNRAVFEAAYLASKSHHAADSADDMEVALFFDLYPDRRPVLLEAVSTVGQLWQRNRVLTLRALLKRQKGPDGGPIAARLAECREDRATAAADVADSLWLTRPALAATLSARTAARKSVDVELLGIYNQGSLTDGLMEGLE